MEVIGSKFTHMSAATVDIRAWGPREVVIQTNHTRFLP